GDDLEDRPGDADVLLTHDIASSPKGIAEAESVAPAGTWLFVSSRTTVRVMPAPFFARVFARTIASGAETAEALRCAGALDVNVPEKPGAAGMLELVPRRAARVLWPRGSDADAAPVETLRERGIETIAPVVYEKRPHALDRELLERVASGGYGAVAVSSL